MKNIILKLMSSLMIVCMLFIFSACDTSGSTTTAADQGASEPNFERVVSPVDYNQNGKDDYMDLVLGARRDAENHPTYDDSYFNNGYPPDNIGVCADVIWRAFREAGYSLRDMVDKDIASRPSAYPKITKPDSNIDFRRVYNLQVFFEKYAISLTNDINKVEEWQPGDIVIFGNNTHIGIVSDKRNADGRPYIIHNGGQKEREEDYLGREFAAFHYRFDASAVDPAVLCPWKG